MDKIHRRVLPRTNRASHKTEKANTWNLENYRQRTPSSLYHCWDDPAVDHGSHSSIGIESIIRRKALRSMRMHSSRRQDRKGRASRKSASIMRRRTNPSLPFWLALVLCYRDGSHLSPSWGALAFSTRQTNERETRYFTEECLIPPIQRCSNESQTAADSINVEALPVVYTNDPKAVSRWIANHVPSEGCVLGFDLESVPETPWLKRKANFRGAAVVQLATPKHALVVHLAKTTGRQSRACGPLIESILADEKIIKAGCSIDQDMIELHLKWRGTEARGRLDLGGVGSSKGEMAGLRTLCTNILQVDLPKSRRLAMSDWSQVPLTGAQLAYCARDAWAGAAVVAELAVHAPGIFGTAALSRRLESQRSVEDLLTRQRNRKQAKNKLMSLQAPYSLSKKGRVVDEEMPTWKRAVVAELRDVMRQNCFDGVEYFDSDELGFANRTI